MHAKSWRPGYRDGLCFFFSSSGKPFPLYLCRSLGLFATPNLTSRLASSIALCRTTYSIIVRRNPPNSLLQCWLTAPPAREGADADAMQGDTHPSTRGRGESLPAGEEKGITGWMGGRARRRTADPTGWSLSHPVLSIRCLHIRTHLHVTSGLALTRGGFLFYLHILWTYLFFRIYLSIQSIYVATSVCT